MVSDLVSPDLSRPAEGLSGASALALQSMRPDLREGFSREVVKFGSMPDEGLISRRRKYARRRRVVGLALHSQKVTGFAPSWDRVRGCGAPIGELVAIKEHEGRVYASGVAQCASVWCCPVCSAKIRTRREVELERACEIHVASGGSLAMLTLTLRHDRSMSLFQVLGALLRSYRGARHRKAFKAIRRLLAGVVRSLEITYGENGWHPHLHLLLFVESEVERESLEALLDDFVTDWRFVVGRDLGVMPSVERAVDLTWFGSDTGAAASYVSKIAKEISQADTKSGRDPFALLDVEGIERDRAVAMFMEYGDAMRGVQSISWTKGLRDRLGLGRVISDEEIIEDVEVGDEVVETIARRDWLAIRREGREVDVFEEIESRLRRQKLFECDEWGEVIDRE